ncbi:myo-inositol 2-dehydrogenase/D-chiro-inositol 1-dehydrogenase [Saccharopolyspora lacisalsi]|uniref:Myo-inositol 2-dehydrogenase/D-chiro-inositol 1-dehydrogenase n=1 Tax=Halosaccharopolyspora lacisalsi TaxID=1000566 RepID=A0A839DYN7_9PSEU|nr:Gfo/Idh/MocA family oxidoreductase [Halosaccharopolyspora lacisalsi]MBA8824331.1 myo-inositol 2-dehydrogenase/D-chiro-inositol 1-dehydrogenase [Halosaccharopolyspora lacisalsi]
MKLGLIGSGRIGDMHARALGELDQVDSLVIADADPARAEGLAERVGADADTVDELYSSGVDGVLIAAATSAHARLVHQALDNRTPVFCEKPVALDVAGTREVVSHAESCGVPVQIGFQRRFDAGYLAAREAVRDGRLGWLHTLRAVTADETPPPADYIPTSGGLFRDCGIHDFDIMRWLTGREVVSVHATGANRGAAFFTEGGDVDTAAAVLTFEDGMLATVTATRYNGAGHDVRLEVCGSDGAMFVGNDERAPLPSAEQDIGWPSGTPYRTFVERFGPAYSRELSSFVEVVAGRAGSPCSAVEALEALYVAEACQLSHDEERVVRLDEVRA